jgi:hypothetical protein
MVLSDLDRLDNGALARRLQADSEVQLVAAASHSPLGERTSMIPAIPEGSDKTTDCGYMLVSPEYFQMLNLPLLRGRAFRPDEAAGQAAVTIVSQATARSLWPDQDPLGKRVRLGELPSGGPAIREAVVVGVTKDVVSGMVFKGKDSTMLYLPASLAARNDLSLLVKTSDLNAKLRSMFPDRVTAAMSLEDALDSQTYPFRAASWIGSVLGFVALALSASAMYGAIAYYVSRRTREIGIRMALGAAPATIVQSILRHCVRLSAIGLAVGLLVAGGVSRVIQHFLERFDAFDILVYGSGIAVVLGAALVAAIGPTIRAARLSPVEALREQ